VPIGFAAVSLDPDSLERLVPDRLDPDDPAAADTLRLHLERYAFAARVGRPGRLLDLACGVGYGTRLLADRNPALRPALGVDLSADAVAHARARYGGDGVSFLAADACRWEDPEGFETIVSLETLEHVEAPELLFARLVAMIRPGGRLVASVPITPSVDWNPPTSTTSPPDRSPRWEPVTGFARWRACARSSATRCARAGGAGGSAASASARGSRRGTPGIPAPSCAGSSRRCATAWRATT
jgi:SAM-dependent methyltransferase